ncbi:MAG: MaoC family dehydratase [Candidatus Dormibacteria bacterium]
MIPALELGDTHSFSWTLTGSDLDAYIEASGDRNPLHTDDAFAQSVGLEGRIAHGLFTLGRIGMALESWGGDAYDLLELTARFAKPLYIGDELRCVARVVSTDAVEGSIIVECSVESSRNEHTLTHCRAVLRHH